jgi:lipoprotein-releasing system permease protein
LDWVTGARGYNKEIHQVAAIYLKLHQSYIFMSPTIRGMLSPIGQVRAMRLYTVAGFFVSGMYEYDHTFAYIRIRDAQEIMSLADSVTGLDIRVTDIYEAHNMPKRSTVNSGFPIGHGIGCR